MQAEEGVYTGFLDIAEGMDYVDICRGRDMRWRIFEAAYEVTESQRKLGKLAIVCGY